jgi:hypothetical protein
MTQPGGPPEINMTINFTVPQDALDKLSQAAMTIAQIASAAALRQFAEAIEGYMWSSGNKLTAVQLIAMMRESADRFGNETLAVTRKNVSPESDSAPTFFYLTPVDHESR